MPGWKFFLGVFAVSLAIRLALEGVTWKALIDAAGTTLLVFAFHRVSRWYKGLRARNGSSAAPSQGGDDAGLGAGVDQR